MTLALSFLPLLALLVILTGLAALPVLGALTALSIALLRHGPEAPLPPVVLFSLLVALLVSIGPVWWLARYADERGSARLVGATALSLALLAAASLSLPPAEMLLSPAIDAVPFPPIDAAVVTVALSVILVGLATCALRSGARHQLAGLLTACEGLLLAASNVRASYAGWLVGVCVMLLAGAGVWLVRRLSLLRPGQDGRSEGGPDRVRDAVGSDAAEDRPPC